MTKLESLKSVIRSYQSMAIAFSGGTDSTLLAQVAKDTLPPENLLLVHVVSPMAPLRETRFARKWAEASGINLVILDLNPLEVPEIKCNCEKRCYYCKTVIMKNVLAEAEKAGLSYVVDGTNTDDYGDYRPGLQATQELGIKHPLAEAKLDKQAIREMAESLGIENWNTPAAACLATRIPTNTPLDLDTMAAVGRSEDYLDQLGFPACRVRVMLPGTAKIEIPPVQFARLIEQTPEIVAKLKQEGFQKILLDLEGYQMGAMNAQPTEDH